MLEKHRVPLRISHGRDDVLVSLSLISNVDNVDDFSVRVIAVDQFDLL